MNAIAALRRHDVAVVRTALVVAALVAAAVAHLQAGPRLDLGGLGLAAPVSFGEEFHTLVPIDARGGPVTLVSARVPGAVAAGPFRADVRLVRNPPGATYSGDRGPLPPDFEVVPLPGHVLRTAAGEYSLDVRTVATAQGRYRVDAVEVTYRAGTLRERTARAEVRLCFLATADRRPADPSDCDDAYR